MKKKIIQKTKFCIASIKQPTTNDNFGGRNNVINVKKSDFEVFQALESDATASIGSAGSISKYYTTLSYGLTIIN